MRVLVVTIYYRPEPVPKPHELAEGLVERGHEVDVLTGFPNYPFGRLYDGYKFRPWKIEHLGGVRVVRLPIFPDHSSRPFFRIVNVLSFFVSVLFAGIFLIRKRPDVVYVWGNPPTSGVAGLILGKLLRAKLVYGIHDLWPELAIETGMLRPSLATRAIGRLEDFMLRMADRSISISEGFRRVLTGRGAPQERLSVIPHWADEKIYKPVPKDESLLDCAEHENRFVVLYAGNIGRMQGLEHLIGAARRLRRAEPSFLFVLIGDGVERTRLRALVAQEKLDNVVFIDPQPAERVVAYSALADVLFVGLIAGPLARLSIPSKVASCMACGKPLLSTVAGETADVIRRTGAGITCDPNEESIANALVALRDCPAEELALMGEKARKAFLNEFSRERLLTEHEKLMDEVSRKAAPA